MIRTFYTTYQRVQLKICYGSLFLHYFITIQSYMLHFLYLKGSSYNVGISISEHVYTNERRYKLQFNCHTYYEYLIMNN